MVDKEDAEFEDIGPVVDYISIKEQSVVFSPHNRFKKQKNYKYYYLFIIMCEMCRHCNMI